MLGTASTGAPWAYCVHEQRRLTDRQLQVSGAEAGMQGQMASVEGQGWTFTEPATRTYFYL